MGGKKEGREGVGLPSTPQGTDWGLRSRRYEELVGKVDSLGSAVVCCIVCRFKAGDCNGRLFSA